MRKLKENDYRLSVSSAATLRACEQKWHNYKVKNYEYDSDYEKGDSLMIGSAFHWLIEETEHRWPKRIVPLLKRYTAEEDENFTKNYYPLLIGMVWSYTKYFESTGLELVAVEHPIEDEEFIGYVDAIYADKKGNWWISDNKTWGYFSPSQAAQLANHVQLNIYAAFARGIAEIYDLDYDKFKGCRIMATTKPKNKQGKLTAKEYAERMKEWCVTWDIEIPRSVLRPQHHLLAHNELYRRSLELREGTSEPKRNYDNCFSYFRPCEYWSRCHGCEYSQGADQVVVRGG